MNNNENRNYIKEYFMQENHDLKSILNVDIANDTKIQEIKKEINRLRKELQLKGEELSKETDKRYSSRFIPLEEKNIIHYEGRTYNSFNGYFDLDSGLAINNTDIGENDNVYKVEKKIDNIQVVVGYDYGLASIIIREYKYTISKDNTTISTKLLKEYNVGFLENKIAFVDFENEEDNREIKELENSKNYYICSALRNVKGKVFIDKLFGVDYKGELDLDKLRDCYFDNKSFEIIMKTCPSEIIDTLLKEKIDTCIPIYKIFGVSQETYNKAVESGIIETLWEYRNYINGSKNEELGINKTEKEWLEFLEEMNNYEQDLDFYGIEYKNNWRGGKTLFETIIKKYTEKDYYHDNYLRDYYSLGKFSNYVISETINQGYDDIGDFISELKDYLSMCKQDNIKPTLYSSYLKQTHDITSRNHKVVVEKENEEIFKSRYSDFKEYNGKNYCVVAPKCSKDLQDEGDRLNHCVASYIKRVIDGDCLIFFLRKKKDESLITFEVRNNRIVQVRGLHNRKPNKEEERALEEFTKYRKMEEYKGC